MQKLTVDDILDVRAYERGRDAFRRDIIEQKRRRRIQLGPIVTLVFENTETMRFQVQEMARAERMATDEQIAHEVATYNALIPDTGELSATMFLELEDEWALREWLPRLVGIQRHVALSFPGAVVRGYDPEEERLTREDVTAAVHFLKFPVGIEHAGALRAGPVEIVVDHPAYEARAVLDTDQRERFADELCA